jgi:hypothetical protein
MAGRELPLALLLGTVFALPACEAGTGGRRISFELAVESAPAERAPIRFQTQTGWNVTLDQACVVVGPIYLYENAGALAARPTRSLPRRLYDALVPSGLYDALVPSAHAHAGDDHFFGGEVRGEWVGQVALDLAQTPAAPLGRLEGIAGVARSVSVGLHPPREAAIGAVPCLRGHQAYVVGAAEKDGVVVPFEGGLDIEDDGQKRTVNGVPAEVELDDDLALALVVDPRAWFQQASFDGLEEVTPEGRHLLTPDSTAYIAWDMGARGPAAFAVRAGPPR